jgi:DNA-binding NtrC family response regulator
VPLSVDDVVFVGDSGCALSVSDQALAPRDVAARATAISARGQRLERELGRAAASDHVVLLVGTSGSGKTWAARQLHERSGRRGAFIALNAAALPTDQAQLRSLLLGHVKGAFTGATADHEGAFVAADGGTLFLDEVDSLNAVVQGFLLTLLEQSGDLAPLGAPVGAPVGRARRGPLSVKVVAASKTPLAQTALRHDLAFRLVDGHIVELPTLAERAEDIPGLVQAFLDELNGTDGTATAFDDDAVAACASAALPGGVRQLRGLVRTLARDAGARVTADAVLDRLAAVERALGGPTPMVTSSSTSASTATATATVTATATKKARQLERTDLEAALAIEGGNMQRAAARLGVARNTLIVWTDVQVPLSEKRACSSYPRPTSTARPHVSTRSPTSTSAVDTCGRRCHCSSVCSWCVLPSAMRLAAPGRTRTARKPCCSLATSTGRCVTRVRRAASVEALAWNGLSTRLRSCWRASNLRATIQPLLKPFSMACVAGLMTSVIRLP